jgi:hypothetical protein
MMRHVMSRLSPQGVEGLVARRRSSRMAWGVAGRASAAPSLAASD